MDGSPKPISTTRIAPREVVDRRGILLVAGSAIVWSFGGVIARGLTVSDSWTVVFWRSTFAGLFLLGFIVWRDGPAGAAERFRSMGWPGVAVACCFATASSSFVIAIGYTTVANVILVQAGVPLFAALIGRVVYGMAVSRGTWLAIAAVMAGIGLMVSDGLGASQSMMGNAFALLMTFMFATATVITRRYEGVAMAPAGTLGGLFAATFAAANAGTLLVAPTDFALLVAFGSLNLGLGLSLFVTGARMIPAALTALIGTAETVLGPIWVWLVQGEIPSDRTLIGGAVVLAALVFHIAVEAWRPRVATAAAGG